MDKNKKKSLYESIMKDVNKFIERRLNEESDYDNLIFDNIEELTDYLDTEIYNLVTDWYVCAADGSSAYFTEEESATVTQKIIDLFKKNKDLL